MDEKKDQEKIQGLDLSDLDKISGGTGAYTKKQSSLCSFLDIEYLVVLFCFISQRGINVVILICKFQFIYPNL